MESTGWISTLFESIAQLLGMAPFGDTEHDLECSIEHSILKRRMESSVEIAFFLSERSMSGIELTEEQVLRCPFRAHL